MWNSVTLKRSLFAITKAAAAKNRTMMRSSGAAASAALLGTPSIRSLSSNLPLQSFSAEESNMYEESTTSFSWNSASTTIERHHVPFSSTQEEKEDPRKGNANKYAYYGNGRADHDNDDDDILQYTFFERSSAAEEMMNLMNNSYYYASYKAPGVTSKQN
jgi:hypothetical protein